MVDLWAALVERYPIVSIEDALAEDEWDGWQCADRAARRPRAARRRRPLRHERRIASSAASTTGVANAILVKVNQIGTLTETLDAIELARSAGYAHVMSHRSGETEDTTIADLAVATGRGPDQDRRAVAHDRVAKYNQLLRIEEELGDRAVYPGLGRVSARDVLRSRLR